MRRVICYVEGASDKLAMKALFAPLIAERQSRGTVIDFFETPTGDRKKSLLLKVPDKAVNILRNDPQAVVAVLPDLFPKNRGFPHETFEELSQGLTKRFRAALKSKRVARHRDMEGRFRVFCFKHDLEVLLLASPEALAAHLGVQALAADWVQPPEDQDLERPPKIVVTEIFKQHGQRYRDTVDAPLILSSADYRVLAERCPQCFAPFAEFLATA